MVGSIRLACEHRLTFPLEELFRHLLPFQSIMDLNHVLMVTVQSYSTEVVKKLTTLMYVHPMGQLLLFLLDRKSTRLNSSHVSISYAVFCLKKKKYTRSQNQDPIKVTS